MIIAGSTPSLGRRIQHRETERKETIQKDTKNKQRETKKGKAGRSRFKFVTRCGLWAMCITCFQISGKHIM